MNATNAIQALGGWAAGYQLGFYNAKVEEIQQGEQYILASLPQWSQFSSLISVADFIVSQKLPPGLIKIATKIALFFIPFAGGAAFPFCAIVKQERYSASLISVMQGISQMKLYLAPTVNLAGPQIILNLQAYETSLSESEINLHGIAKLKTKIKLLTTRTTLKIFNKIIPLPDILQPRTTEICCFVAKNSTKIMRITGIVTAVALTAILPHYAAGMLTGVLYEAAKSRGYVPHRINLFVETYTPILSAVGAALTGGLFAKLLLVTAIAQCHPDANLYLQARYDSGIRGTFDAIQNEIRRRFPGVPPVNADFGTKLSEYDASLQNNKNMSYDDIIRIVEGYYPVEIDPAHCSKSIGDIYNLPENHNFDQLLTHFNTIDWVARYEYVKRKAADDDRFLVFVHEQTGIPREALGNLETLDRAITNLANQGGLTKQVYMANWLQQQMQSLVDGLQGRRAVEGLASDLEASKENVSKVLACLDGMPHHADFEDMLCKIAVEGGAYCARGVKRMSSELVHTIALQGIAGVHLRNRKLTLYGALTSGVTAIAAAVVACRVSNLYVKVVAGCVSLVAACVTVGIYKRYRAATRAPAPVVDPAIAYEVPIRCALEASRKRLYEGTYNQMVQHVLGAMGQDVHVADMFRIQLSLGFVPVSHAERRNIAFTDIFFWNLYSEARQRMMLNAYERNIDDEFHEFLQTQKKDLEFTLYVRSLITNNPNLTEEQKNEFEEKMADYEYFGHPHIQQGFRRLILTSLGILKKPPVPPVPEVAGAA